jgi:hypothetical protein
LEDHCTAKLGEDFLPMDTPQIYYSNAMDASNIRFARPISYYYSSLCTNLRCQSKSDPSISTYISTGDGTLCSPGSVCQNGNCLKINGTPAYPLNDSYIGEKTCKKYLNENEKIANRLCQVESIRTKCPISCLSIESNLTA